MKIIQITDTHLVPPGIAVNGVDPEKQLRAAVADIVEKHADADLLVMTGDLCNYGEPEAYELLRDILAPVSIPVQLMLGNHDRRRHRLQFRSGLRPPFHHRYRCCRSAVDGR